MLNQSFNSWPDGLIRLGGLIKIFIHSFAQRENCFACNLITRLNPRAVKFGMTEETDVNADGHPGLKNVIAVWTEERGFRLMQADGMDKWANEVF